MSHVMDHPFFVLLIALLLLWAATRLGVLARRRRSRTRPVEPDEREDLGVILAATLTMLGLIIGFSFSMAIGRYDTRKSFEEAEANAIGTEYLRADLLASDKTAVVKDLLARYTNTRIAFYRFDKSERQQIDTETERLQTALWGEVRVPPTGQTTATTTLVISGMNDVINSQGYTQAAWWNRIPLAAWFLMFAFAICANLLLGFSARRPESQPMLLVVLPLLVAVAFFLIADIDSPRGGDYQGAAIESCEPFGIAAPLGGSLTQSRNLGTVRRFREYPERPVMNAGGWIGKDFPGTVYLDTKIQRSEICCDLSQS